MRCYLMTSREFEDAPSLRDVSTSPAFTIVSLRQMVSHMVLSDGLACVLGCLTAERCVYVLCLIYFTF
jgi:hypothetical protein